VAGQEIKIKINMKNIKITLQKLKHLGGQAGFSFVELIVVVTIIMVITVVGTVSYQSTSQKSRDGKRMSDLQKLAVALEMYKQENGIYPAVPSDLVSEYMQELPKDPKDPSFSYLYSRTPTNYSYVLFAKMENVGSTNFSPATPGCGSTCNYRLYSP
jgi:general secretion pathway protein G